MKILVFMTISLLSTGLARAQEPLEIFNQALASTEGCRAETEKVPLDTSGEPKDNPKTLNSNNSGNLVRKLREDKNYIRAMKELRDTITIKEYGTDVRTIEAKLPQELVYEKFGISVVKLQKLEVTLAQNREGERWIPALLEVTIRFWRRTGLWSNVHDRYDTRFSCEVR